jgi:hypothetical protein
MFLNKNWSSNVSRQSFFAGPITEVEDKSVIIVTIGAVNRRWGKRAVIRQLDSGGPIPVAARPMAQVCGR